MSFRINKGDKGTVSVWFSLCVDNLDIEDSPEELYKQLSKSMINQTQDNIDLVFARLGLKFDLDKSTKCLKILEDKETDK